MMSTLGVSRDQVGEASAVVMAVGPGEGPQALDTVASIRHYCGNQVAVIVVDDATSDGTYEVMREVWAQDSSVYLLRNGRPLKMHGLWMTLASGFTYCLDNLPAVGLVLKTDTDALVVGHSLFSAARCWLSEQKARVGIFGRYHTNFDGSAKDYSMHARTIAMELSWRKRLWPGKPYWANLCTSATRNGWPLGLNVFGGGYFVTRACLASMAEIGALVGSRQAVLSRSRLPEDVYFTMAAFAAGYVAEQYGWPEGRLALAWRGLPASPAMLLEAGAVLVHSVDKGPHVETDTSGGNSVRALFRARREAESRDSLHQESAWRGATE